MSQSEVVRSTPWVKPPVTSDFPGHDGPRPQLGFVLKCLAGDDRGITALHLSIPRPWADSQTIQITTDSMLATMTMLADLWIDSGRSDGVDNPLRRHVEYGTFGSSIATLFYSLIGDEARLPQIHKNGRQSLKEVLFGLTLADGSDDETVRLVLRHFGAKVAIYWFAKLLNSPYSRLLTRCEDCRTYFAYERVPRTDRKNSIRCHNCKKNGSAERMSATRRRRTAEMVAAAADALLLRKPNSRQPLTKWLAEEVNRRRRRSHYPTVTGRWITQHMPMIEAEVERRKHATR